MATMMNVNMFMILPRLDLGEYSNYYHIQGLDWIQIADDAEESNILSDAGDSDNTNKKSSYVWPNG